MPRPCRPAARCGVRHPGSRLAGTRSALLAVLLLPWLTATAVADKWDPITREELAVRAEAADTAAGAEALFWKVWLEDELRVTGMSSTPLVSTQRHYFRIKVHSAAAAQELSRREVRLSPSSRLLELSARTVQPDGSIAVMAKGSVSRETAVRYQGRDYKRVTFAAPNVRPGCVLEYQYSEMQDDRLALYNSFPLQLDMPARRVVYHLRPASFEGWTSRMMAFRAALPPSREEKGYRVVEFTDVPAFRSEPHMPSPWQLQSWMLLYYTNEELRTPAQYWGERAKELARDYEDWCKADRELRQVAYESTEGAEGDWARLHRIADWCRRQLRVVRSSHPDSVKPLPRGTYDARTVLRKRVADPNDANRMFGALARAAGFQVRMTRVPSRRSVSFSPEMVNMMFLSRVHVAVRMDGAWRPFDPENRWLPWDMLPWDTESQMSLFCDDQAPQFLRTQVAGPGRSMRSRIGELSLAENGDLSGDVAVRLTGHWNQSFHEAVETDGDTLAALRETLQWGADELELSRLRVARVPDEHEEFAATVHVQMTGHASIAGTRLLLEPTAWWAKRAPEFAESHRVWPVAFRFAWSDHDSLRVRLPDGWKVETLPESRPVRAAGVAAYRLSIATADSGHAIDCVRSFQMGEGGTLYFPVESYPDLRKLNDAFLDRDRTSVPLVREADGR